MRCSSILMTMLVAMPLEDLNIRGLTTTKMYGINT